MFYPPNLIVKAEWNAMVLMLTGSDWGAEVVVDSEADVNEDDEDEVVLV